MTELRTERLLLRRWRDSDRKPFFLVNSDPRVMEFYPRPFTRRESDEVMDRYEKSFKEKGFGRFAVERCSDHAFMGMIGLAIATHPTQREAFIDFGWRLSPDFWGQGFATEGAREVVKHAFEDLKLDALVALAAEANMRSRRVMEKLNMTHDPADDFDEPKFPVGHRA
ncbi:MAG TPA: GNAT family N-acetyltransferase, partial [Candidatus Acidoferrales bacterium]|nr:GNAT family N-acetyltransferase [Candidatus Acidoferrales bacterium]